MTAPRPSPVLTFALDFGPLLAFFAAFKLWGVFTGTGVFMAAILVSMIASLIRFRRVSPMSAISAVLVIGFGGLTLWLHDPKFIQMKPTIIYSGFALFLFGGLLFRRPLLKYVFGMMFEGLSEQGWRNMSRNWAFFFAAMALLNEALRRSLDFETWLTVKVWGVPLLSVLFAAANLPMLMRHGFGKGAEPEDVPVPPPSL